MQREIGRKHPGGGGGGGLYQRPGKGIVGPGLGANTYQKEYISGGSDTK